MGIPFLGFPIFGNQFPDLELGMARLPRHCNSVFLDGGYLSSPSLFNIKEDHLLNPKSRSHITLAHPLAIVGTYNLGPVSQQECSSK